MISLAPLLVIVATLPAPPVVHQTNELLFEFKPRTANQMASFYEARGFPKSMVDIIKQQCFITIAITNNSKEKIWMDLSRWQFSVDGKPIKREHRDVWKQRWTEMGMPKSKLSTFRWTLIPESLDYLPGEREGGNVILPFTDKYITLTASFASGDNQQGKTLQVTTNKLYCAEEPQ